MQKYDKLTQTLMFPTIIKGIRGSDTSIEFVTELTLQTIRMGVKNFPAVQKSVYIFIQTSATPVENPRLKPIEYTNADMLANKARMFF